MHNINAKSPALLHPMIVHQSPLRLPLERSLLLLGRVGSLLVAVSHRIGERDKIGRERSIDVGLVNVEIVNEDTSHLEGQDELI